MSETFNQKQYEQATPIPAKFLLPDGTVVDELPTAGGGGSGGTSDYTSLLNKPKINGVTLNGDKSASDLGLASKTEVENKVEKEDGKQLSTNDYSNEDKEQVENIAGIEESITGINENLAEINEAIPQLFEKANNWLYGKTINFLGDSITEGMLTSHEDIMERPYPYNVSKLLECTCNNYGKSGSTLVDSTAPYTYKSFIDRMKEMDKNADVNVVMGGINDFSHNTIILGNLSDTAPSTIYGALNTIAQYLINNFPKAINIFCSPTRIGSIDNGKYAMEELVYAVKSVAKKYGFVFIDTYHNLPMWMPNNSALVSRYGVNGTDTTHMNQLFSDTVFGKYMAESILRLDGGNALTPKDKPFVREILDFSNYFEGLWIDGKLKGYVEDGILCAYFNACRFLQGNGGAAFNNAVSGHWNDDEYKTNIKTDSVDSWKTIQTISGENIAFMYLGNGSNAWSWQSITTYTGDFPTNITYSDMKIPLDR